MADPHVLGTGMTRERLRKYAMAFLRDLMGDKVRDYAVAGRRLRTRLGMRMDIPPDAIRAWVREVGYHPADIVLTSAITGYVGWYPTRTTWRQAYERLPLDDKKYKYLWLYPGYVFKLREYTP